MIDLSTCGDNIYFTAAVPPVPVPHKEALFREPSGCQLLSPLSKIIMPGHPFFFYLQNNFIHAAGKKCF
jgi:hypothetical protein